MPRDVRSRDSARVEQPAIICDGGYVFWGALYDPSTQTFSQLELNGPG